MNVNMLFLTDSQKSGDMDIFNLRAGCKVAVLRPSKSMYMSTSLRGPFEK